MLSNTDKFLLINYNSIKVLFKKLKRNHYIMSEFRRSLSFAEKFQETMAMEESLMEEESAEESAEVPWKFDENEEGGRG